MPIISLSSFKGRGIKPLHLPCLLFQRTVTLVIDADPTVLATTWARPGTAVSGVEKGSRQTMRQR
ncbi:hypothetical protein AB0758_43795 [Tolypothrix bouteillei VB521301_2]